MYLAFIIHGEMSISNLSSHRCLVLGGAGFIGSHVADALQQRGHIVHILDKKPSPWWQAPAKSVCFWGDWNNPSILQSALQGCDTVIHLIGTSLPATSNQDIPADVQANLTPTLQLLEVCRINKIKRVVFASSGGTVYGLPKHIPITEDHPTQPLNSYGIVKLTIENYLRLYHHLHDLGYVILRGANPYGERQNPYQSQGAVGVFLGRLARGEPITIWGDGSVVRDYFHVRDMAHAFVLATEASLNAGLFNIGSGQGMSLTNLLTQIAIVTGRQPQVTYAPARVVDVPVNVLAVDHARTQLGWQPKIDLTTGLRQTWQWIVEQVL